MRKTMIGCGILLVILTVVLIGSWVYLDHLDKWYIQVQTELPEVKSKLITLNHATLSLLPPPDHVTEIGRHDWGENTSYEYGVLTYIDYRIEDSTLDVQAYYRSMMDRLGWILSVSSNDPQSFDYQKYYHDETCVEIMTYQTNRGVYGIIVYRDFEKQDFSPHLPPMWYVKGIRQYGKTIVSSCP
jgi:hypothetical protein